MKNSLTSNLSENGMEVDLEDEVTVVSTTHFTEKCVKNSHLAPPTTGLIEKTFDSMYKKFGVSDNTDKIIIYSSPEHSLEGGSIYRRNLEEFADRTCSMLINAPNVGSRTAREIALKNVNTDYILYVEHDWEFQRKIPLKNIIAAMNGGKSLNYIRFNKRENIEQGWDTILVEDNKYDIPLLKTSCFSNNPHIAKTKNYKKWIDIANPKVSWTLRMIDDPQKVTATIRQLVSIYMKGNTHNDNVEEYLDRYMKYNIDKYGFDKAHRLFGFYLFGSFGDAPFVKHLGE